MWRHLAFFRLFFSLLNSSLYMPGQIIPKIFVIAFETVFLFEAKCLHRRFQAAA
jgi:hypothetical protein